jgi:polysaccharide export outer membrane protein
MQSKNLRTRGLLLLLASAMLASPLAAQTTPQLKSANTGAGKPQAPQTLPKDYVIGADDVLSVVFWNAKELSSEVLVRPDGKISLPLLSE